MCKKTEVHREMPDVVAENLMSLFSTRWYKIGPL